MHFLAVVLFGLLLALINTFESCPQIRLSDYEFDLQPLKHTTGMVAFFSDGNTIRLSPCSQTTCPSNISKKGFFIKTSDCQSYSLDQNPLRNDFSLISNDQPQKGLKISYLPLSDNPGSINQTLYATLLQINCKEQNQENEQPTCVQYQTKLYDRKTFQLNCTILHASGCPTLVNNYFWTFLRDNKIAFAITIWIISLFQLLLGYCFIRITIFLMGIMTGLLFGLLFIAQTYENFLAQSTSMCIFIIFLALLLGIMVGISLLTIPKLGHMNIGVWVAVVIGLLLQNGLLFLSNTLLAFYIITGVLVLVMIIISLLALRYFIILSTSFLSAFGLVRPLGFFLPHYPNELTEDIYETARWQFYLYFIGIIILTILGCSFQFCLLRYRGRDNTNKAYYLDDNDATIRQKLKNLLQFDQVKKLARMGKQEVLFFKNLVMEKQEENQKEQQKDDSNIQMEQIVEKPKQSKQKPRRKMIKMSDSDQD